MGSNQGKWKIFGSKYCQIFLELILSFVGGQFSLIPSLKLFFMMSNLFNTSLEWTTRGTLKVTLRFINFKNSFILLYYYFTLLVLWFSFKKYTISFMNSVTFLFLLSLYSFIFTLSTRSLVPSTDLLGPMIENLYKYSLKS